MLLSICFYEQNYSYKMGGSLSLKWLREKPIMHVFWKSSKLVWRVLIMIIFLERRSDGTHTVLPWSWTRDFKLKVRFSKSLAFYLDLGLYDARIKLICFLGNNVVVYRTTQHRTSYTEYLHGSEINACIMAQRSTSFLICAVKTPC